MRIMGVKGYILLFVKFTCSKKLQQASSVKFTHQVNLKSITPTSLTRVSLAVRMRNFILTALERLVQIPNMWDLDKELGELVGCLGNCNL